MESEFFVHNRQWLRQLFVGSAPIVITASGLLQKNSDVTYKFRQDSNFWYLTGLSEPDLILVIDKDKEYLILPDRGEQQNIFDGSLNPESLSKTSGIKEVFDNKTGWKQLNTKLKKVKHIATLAAAPVYVEALGFYSNPARLALVKRLKDVNSKAELLDLRSHLTKMRALKQPAEIEALQRAIDITADTLKQVKKKLKNYKHEYEIEADLSQGFRRRGADGHGFPPIVASGANSCTVHYVSNNAPIDKKGLVILDVGAQVNNYCADISRTFAVSKPTKRQKAIYEGVVEVQNYAVSCLKPGVILRDYEQKVENYMGEKLRELHLIKSISRENVRKYYPHSTTHFLGLDAHDVGNYDQPLEPNMILTVEPGIYIPEEKIGVRIEDDVILTTDGLKVLSKRLPKRLW